MKIELPTCRSTPTDCKLKYLLIANKVNPTSGARQTKAKQYSIVVVMYMCGHLLGIQELRYLINISNSDNVMPSKRSLHY